MRPLGRLLPRGLHRFPGYKGRAPGRVNGARTVHKFCPQPCVNAPFPQVGLWTRVCRKRWTKKGPGSPCGPVSGRTRNHTSRSTDREPQVKDPPRETETAGQVASSEYAWTGWTTAQESPDLDARRPSGDPRRRRSTPLGEVASATTGCGCRADRRTDDHIVVATRRPADDDAGDVKAPVGCSQSSRPRRAAGADPLGVSAPVAHRVPGRSRTVSAASVVGPPTAHDLRARRGPSDAYSEGPSPCVLTVRGAGPPPCSSTAAESRPERACRDRDRGRAVPRGGEVEPALAGPRGRAARPVARVDVRDRRRPPGDGDRRVVDRPGRGRRRDAVRARTDLARRPCGGAPVGAPGGLRGGPARAGAGPRRASADPASPA